MQKFTIIMRDLEIALSRRNFFDFESPDSAFRDKSVSDDINEIFFFFLNAIPVFCHTVFTVPFRSAVFPLSNSILPILSFLQVVRRGSGALSPATHAHSTSHSQTYTTLIHPWAPFPDGTRTRADLAVVAERVLILPSTTLPLAPTRHTHTSMSRRSFLPSKKSSPFGGIRTH
jgi:hypothetical protein